MFLENGCFSPEANGSHYQIQLHHLKLLQYDDEYDEDFVGDVYGAGGGGDCGTMVIIQLI